MRDCHQGYSLEPQVKSTALQPTTRVHLPEVSAASPEALKRTHCHTAIIGTAASRQCAGKQVRGQVKPQKAVEWSIQPLLVFMRVLLHESVTSML